MKSAKTRRGFTGLVVCGAAVLVWGAADLYAWATTGQEVLAAYGEAAANAREEYILPNGGKRVYNRPA